jgi:hypothetical protein
MTTMIMCLTIYMLLVFLKIKDKIIEFDKYMLRYP